jgi:hypothetical protein
LPQSGCTRFSGGTQWFWGYCIDNDRAGDPGRETFTYRFVGPYRFFFERLIFQKLQLTWNGVKQIADYQSDVVLGLSLTTLSGTGDTVQSSTATNLMSIAQQVKEICLYAQADSVYQQANNGLGWPNTAAAGQPANAQFQCDALTQAVDGVNYDLLNIPSANTLISDYASGNLANKTSASALPAGSYMLRAPLDACNAITCAEALRRQLQWIGGIGSPVIWTDHSQTPPQLHAATRDRLSTRSLALTGIAVKNKIKKRSDLIPAAVHFKYKVAGSYLAQPYSVVVNDVAGYVGGVLYEGIGQLGALTSLTGTALDGSVQTALMAAAKTATAMVQTLDFQGDQVNAASCKITTQALNMADPSGTGADGGFWATLFPELNNVSKLRFYNNGSPGVTIKDAATGAIYYANGAWTGAAYINRVTDGQVAPWMLASTSTPKNPVGGQTVKVTLTVRFQYSENAQGANTVTSATVGYHEKNITLTLSTLTTGTYYSSPSVSSGEPVPYGLAGYILALESIPQYEGSLVVQETEISDVCPLGSALNITGGQAEWAAMNACVQEVRYGDNGQTEIIFGPAKHLGPAQFVARFRNNVGPRWYLLIGGDLMNQANPGALNLGNNIPADAPSPGNKSFTFQSFFAALPSDQNSTPATLPAGVHIDSGGGGAPTTPANFAGGAIASGQRSFATPGAAQQRIILAQGPNGGAGGEASAWIRLDIGDLENSSNAVQNLHLYLREMKTCESGVASYRLFLASEPYTASIRGSHPDL